MTTHHRPSFSAALCYRDPKAALAWLERAFGFERSLVVTTPEGDIAHAEMKFGDGVVMIGGTWADFIASPEDTGDAIPSTSTCICRTTRTSTRTANAHARPARRSCSRRPTSSTAIACIARVTPAGTYGHSASTCAT